jgi:hypothetical protein
MRSLNLDTTLQLGVNSKIDLSETGELVRKAKAEGADETLTPLHVVTVVAAVADAVKKIVDAFEHGDLDAPLAAASAKYVYSVHLCGSSVR